VLQYEEGLQRPRAAKEQQAAAGGYNREQMGGVMNAAHENQQDAVKIHASQRFSSCTYAFTMSARGWTGHLTAAMSMRLGAIAKCYIQE
jgi:hypothetical protein